MDDTQIIALYWQRSSDAIRASEEAYGAYCFTVANRIVENREDAEECVSDTWLRAWYAMPPEKPNYLRMFFAAITRNLSLDRVRASLTAKRGGGQAVLALEELSECVSGSPEVEDAIIAAELSASVNRFLNTLSPAVFLSGICRRDRGALRYEARRRRGQPPPNAGGTARASETGGIFR